MRNITNLIVFTLLIALVSGIVLPAFQLHAASNTLSLSLAEIPPVLPADGNSYPALVVSLVSSSNKPAVLTNDTVVYLASSQQNVGSVPASVVIPAGKSYVLANFTTTSIAGTTTVTAQSVGINSASVQVKTATPSGYPTTLKVFPIPSSQLAQPLSAGGLIVEMVDNSGLPAKAVSTTVVTLSSANTGIAYFPTSTVTIPQGSFMALSVYETSLATGTTTLTASASGFFSGNAPVSVVGVSPLALHLYLVPPTVRDHTAAKFVVALTDLQGRPARAPTNIPVTVTQSNTTVVTVPSQVVIPTGNISVEATYNTLAAGTTTISVSAQGLQGDTETLNVKPVVGALSLQLYLAPNPVLADKGVYNSVVVALVNGSNPGILATPVTVNLTSNNLAVGKVTQSVTIPAGGTYAIVNFTSTFLVGTTTIMAQAKGLYPSSIAASTFGPIPTQVVVTAAPSTLPADGGSYSSLAVTLEDPSGNPAIAPVGITVQLSSSNPNILTTNSTVVIPAGSTYALTSVSTTTSPGTATITATATGYAGSSTQITTVQPGATKLGIYVYPTDFFNMPSGNDTYMAVQLQDTNGNPAKSRSSVAVTITSSTSSVLSQPIVELIPAGSTYAGSYVSFNSPGSSSVTTSLTASAQGLTSSSIQVTIEPYPLSFSVSLPSTQLQQGQTAVVTASVTLGGQGLGGATVKWSSTNCQITPVQSTTSSAGIAQATLSSCNPGSAVITASLSSPVIGNPVQSGSLLQQTATLSITQPPPKPSPLQLLLTFPYVLILVAVIIIAVLGVLIFIRRRNSNFEEM
ncbi:MAG: hypothetical protein QXV32_08980 [Conexivisphaerales archaeon]